MPHVRTRGSRAPPRRRVASSSHEGRGPRGLGWHRPYDSLPLRRAPASSPPRTAPTSTAAGSVSDTSASHRAGRTTNSLTAALASAVSRGASSRLGSGIWSVSPTSSRVSPRAICSRCRASGQASLSALPATGTSVARSCSEAASSGSASPTSSSSGSICGLAAGL